MIRLIEILASGVRDDSDAVLDSGTVTSYLAGTTELETLYQDFELTEPHANPLTLSSTGRAIAFTNERVKLVFHNSTDELIRTVDNVGTSDDDVPTSVSQSIPSGSIIGYGGSSAPTGWLLCDGTAVSRTTYAALFAAIGESYGVGDSTTTFNLPDSPGRVLVGAGAGSGLTTRARGDEFGVETVTLTAAQSGVPAHTHGITDPGHIHSFSVNGTPGSAAKALQGDSSSSGNANTASATTGITVTDSNATASAASSHTNVQPSFVGYYIIKT